MRLFIRVFPGLCCFLFLTKGKILDVTYVSWLLDGDPAMSWIGWQFFRTSDLFQIPWGLNPYYGLEISSSIVYSDSIPLFSILFKLFNSLLPTQFQFFGIWILLCFLLQSYFASKLLGLFVSSSRLRFLFTFFFCLAPCFLWRLHGHYSLCAHWVILAGLYGYFNRKFSFSYWLILVFLSSLIHPYICFFCLSFFCIDLLQRALQRQLSFYKVILLFCLCVSILGAGMYSAGYFSLGSDLSSDTSGYRMNLLSVFDAEEGWSRIFPDIPGERFEYEGFNFIGTGILILIVFCFLSFRKGTSLFLKPKMIPLGFFLLFLFFYSLSEKINFADKTIFVYQYPVILEPFHSVFRANGRFFWPVLYTIYLVVMIQFYKSISKKWIELVTFVILIIFVFDLYPKIEFFQKRFDVPTANQKQLVAASPEWTKISKPYRSMYLVFPENKPKHWETLALVALENRLSINFGYFTRLNRVRLLESKNKLAKEIEQGNFSDKILYVFSDKRIWSEAVSRKAEVDLTGEIDGIYFLAPKFLLHEI
ncbi:DUF6311 domain-containing protein [Leptospira idonii]|uniref:Dolichyl-phosphate-mannose--protein mannosyltransferase n=1 Tax=Leptospira idonii TaxID=1193500 RepID=A0A4R9LY86_9LEPT|nr:DUF6311 domain-containing protein [Leptospira idonii]TGN18307.1 hypothetical protein EHS15_12945 [Leptospira idonii]